MKFEWDMTEKEWNRYKKDCHLKEWISDDYYGKVLVGNLSIEFQITDENKPFTNWFCLYKDSGYGYTESGIPYDLLDDYFLVPIKCKSFDNFKEICEKRICKLITASEQLLNEANQPIAKWQ